SSPTKRREPVRVRCRVSLRSRAPSRRRGSRNRSAAGKRSGSASFGAFVLLLSLEELGGGEQRLGDFGDALALPHGGAAEQRISVRFGQLARGHEVELGLVDDPPLGKRGARFRQIPFQIGEGVEAANCEVEDRL